MQEPKPLEVSMPSEREVRIVRAFHAPRRLVFDAFTKPELVKRWLTGPEGWTMPVCRIDLKPGGAFRYEWQHADGRGMGMNGTFVEITPPSRTVHKEIFDEDWTDGETTVTTEFAEAGGRTTVTMTILYVSREARDKALGTGMTRGMEESYEKLDALLAGGK